MNNYNLPNKYLENMKTLLKEDFDAYLSCFEQNKTLSLRVNNLKIETEKFKELSNFNLVSIPWVNNGFYYEEEDSASKHHYHYAGLYYLQEASAMIPASLLPIDEGDIVLDLCAAPGGKSTELLNKLNGYGLLVSNDISASRAKALLRNLEKQGADNFYVISEDSSKLRNNFKECFDKILIDAPCSGEGMFRKDKDLIKAWNDDSNAFYANLQKQIIEDAYEMLKPGGMMLYSTCTFSPSEDEEVIQSALDNHKDLSLVKVNKYKDFCGGLNGLKECVRVYPFKVKGEGHFAALLKKEGSIKKELDKENELEIPKPLLDFFSHINKKYFNKQINVINDVVYFVPNNSLNFKGIRILRSGLMVGEIKNNRFNPSQALAMSLKENEFDNVLNLEVDDIRVEKYLRGESIQIDRALKDYILVCVDGYPLGFGKANNGILNNRIDKGWRKV